MENPRKIDDTIQVPVARTCLISPNIGRRLMPNSRHQLTGMPAQTPPVRTRRAAPPQLTGRPLMDFGRIRLSLEGQRGCPRWVSSQRKLRVCESLQQSRALGLLS